MAQALALAGLFSFSPPASAIEYWLRAEPLPLRMPGASACRCGAMPVARTPPSAPAMPRTVPGPALTVPVGDPVLTVHLKNNLP